MDTASTILITVIVIFLIFKLFGFLGRLGIKQITPRELDQKKGMVLLDVRSDKEYAQGHIPGAVHVPLGEIGDKVKKLKKDKEPWSIAAAATRASGRSRRLMGMGYKNLYNLKGGYSAWKRLHP